MYSKEKELFFRRYDQPLTAKQTFILDYQLYSPESTMYNKHIMIRMSAEKVDLIRLKKAIRQTLQNHPIFRTLIRSDRFVNFVQSYYESLDTEFTEKVCTEADMKQFVADMLKPFTLLNKQLYRLAIYETEKYIYLYFDIHHIFTDMETFDILLREVNKAYNGEELDMDYFYSYLAENALKRHSEEFKEAKQYFSDRYDGCKWTTVFKKDIDSRKNKIRTKTSELTFTKKELDSFLEENNLDINGFFSVVALLTLSLFSNQNDVMTSFSYNERSGEMLDSTAGIFSNRLPVALSLNKIDTVRDLWKDIKQQIEKDIEYSFFPYIFNDANVAVNDTFEIQDRTEHSYTDRIGDVPFEIIRLDIEAEASSHLMLMKILNNNCICIRIKYNSECYEENTVDSISKLIGNIASELLKHDTGSSEKFTGIVEKIRKKASKAALSYINKVDCMKKCCIIRKI